MASLLSNGSGSATLDYIMDLYDLAMSKEDPRTKDWLFIKSPLPTIITILIYYVIVWKGPKLMENRKPVHLGHFLTVYNFALVGYSSYMTFEFFMSAYLAGYSIGCQPVDYSNDPLALRMAKVCWLYYFSKFIEIADTVFFILRKKTNQITFLHVYHHSTMILIWWINVKYIPGGVAFFHPLLNSFVHVIMYSYYGLSALGPTIQPYLWWKKYVTKIQLTQFLFIFIHCLYVTTQCDFPIGLSSAALTYDISMIMLFCNYYYQEYIRRAQERRRLQTQQKQQTTLLLPAEKQTSRIAEIQQNGAGYHNGTQKYHIE